MGHHMGDSIGLALFIAFINNVVDRIGECRFSLYAENLVVL